MKRAGYIALIGRPNSGKSTLMNAICGHKIAIVSHVPQTTRQMIKGIYTKDDDQIIFLDTPGIHESIKTYNQLLKKQAVDALYEADAVLYVIDLARSYGREEEGIMDLLRKAEKRVFIAFNKTDLTTPEVIQNSLAYQEIIKNLPHSEVFYVSALKNKHIEELIAGLKTILPEQEHFYPEGTFTDQTMYFQCAELIREQVMTRTFDEIPHAARVEVSAIEDDENLVKIHAEVLIERDSQKGILIGEKAEKIKKIGTEARKELEKLFHKKVFLNLQVHVDKNWRNG